MLRWSPLVLCLVLVASPLSARAQDSSNPGDGLPLPPIATSDDGSTSSSTDTTVSSTGASSSSPDPNDVYGPHPAGTMLAPVRQQVVAAALGEVGAVSDKGGTGGFKKGWERLKKYFDEATDWGPDCFTQGAWVQNGIQQAGKNPPGAEWCGIFASWCFQQGGVSVKWKWGVGPRPLTIHYDKNNVQPGDIGVIAQYSHHFIVVKRDGDRIWTVSGNSSYHGITQDSPRAVSSLVGYYRPTEDVWVPDDGTVTPVPASAGSGSATSATTTPGLAGAVAQATGSTPASGAAASDPAASGAAADPGTSAPTSAAQPVCHEGATGEPVKTIQGLLNVAGASLDVDGSFGPATAKAVRAFQQSHGCRVDGVVGPETWAALEAAGP